MIRQYHGGSSADDDEKDSPFASATETEIKAFHGSTTTTDSTTSSTSSTTTTRKKERANRAGSIRGGSTTTDNNDTDDMTHEDPHMNWAYRRMSNRRDYEEQRLNATTDVQAGQENTTYRSTKKDAKDLLMENKEIVAAAGAVAFALAARR